MNFGNVVPLSSFCAFEKQEGKANESCKNHERYNGNFVEKMFGEQKPRYLVTMEEVQEQTKKKTQEVREKNNLYKKAKWDLQGNKNKG